MPTSKITEAADDLADTVASAGRGVGNDARQAGADVGDAVRSASTRGAAQIRRTANRSEAAYDEGADALGARAGSLEDSIRRNALAAAGAALLVGVVLGRFFL